MHLTKDGFETLISNDNLWPGIAYFGDRPWSTLWEEFYAEASRFDGRRLRSLFGEAYRPVRPLPSKDSSWEDFDYLLVGEFLRRHHPRLAHEIALNGLPAKDGRSIKICPRETDEEKFWADISGLVARSHGMDLRVCLAYLEQRYNNKINPRRAHAVFTAALLRIADYFQIQAKRAPAERTDVLSFQSQLSSREWKVHQCVTDIHNTGGDPEAIVVIAAPTDVETFLRLENWLRGIQEELDRTWAILGEVYGLQRHNDLDKLGLKIRRVKSNLDDTSKFSEGVGYVPKRIAFEAANADLLKLLVAPLYDDDPGIGIRELLQNALDAVREFEDFAQHRPELSSLHRYDQTTDVLLQVECNDKGLPVTITITDRGVGMTADIVQEYFLKAGASFRKSNAWRQDHENSDGRSRVLRTGRFGVGALAAFLLGDEIEVTTRHIFSDSDAGVTFKAKLDDEAISLSRTSAPVGTRIRINVPSRLQGHVSRIVPQNDEATIHFSNPAGHYFLKKPSLKREFSNRSKNFEPAYWLPLQTECESENWRCFSNADFEKVFWCYRGAAPYLACNGIVVDAYGQNHRGYRSHRLNQYLRQPNLSVFDKNGYLPINLQRTSLQTANLPFEDDLLRSITDDLIAHAIAEAPLTAESTWLDGEYEGFLGRTNALGGHDQWSKWLVGRDGFVLNDAKMISLCDPKFLIVAVGGRKGFRGFGEHVRKSIPSNTLMASYSPRCLSDTNPRIKGLFRDALVGNFYLEGARFDGGISVIPSSLSKKIERLSPGRDLIAILRSFDDLEDFNGWKCKAFGLGLTDDFPIEFLKSLTPGTEDPVMFCVLRVNQWKAERLETCSKQWISLINEPMIPFDLESRGLIEEKVKGKIGHLLELRRSYTAKHKKDFDRNLRLDEAIT